MRATRPNRRKKQKAKSKKKEGNKTTHPDLEQTITMAPKQFSLDSILTYRKRQENLANEQFVLAKIAAENAATILETAKNNLNSLIFTLEEKQATGISIEELSRYEERIQFERTQIRELEKILAAQEKTAQRKRTQLLKKIKDFKILDALKEQQNKTWQDYISKKEAAMLDEIAILHHDRSGR